MEWKPTPVFLPGKLHGQRSLVGCSPWGCKESDMTEQVTFNIRETLLLLLLSHFSRVRLCVTPWMAAHQAPLSLGFSRQEHWSGLPLPSPMHESEKWKWSRSVMSDSQRPHGLQPTRLLRPWDFPGKGTGVGCHCLLRRKTLVSSKFNWTFMFPGSFFFFLIFI